jgi:thiosulfate reductase/polysulfide reductase chain A
MDITGWADVVLPDTTYLERYDELRISQGRVPQAALRAPALKPKYNSRPAWWIAKNLAQKMGLGDYFQWNSIEDYLDFRLKKIGSSLEEMKRIGVKSLERETSLYIPKNADYKFPTESGKIELYSKQLEASGFNPLPVFTEPDVPGKGFYRLLSGRSPMHSFARTINNPVLSRLMRENEIWIHTSVAREWGISNSQYIKLENQDGVVSLPVKAKVTERIRPDCVFMVHGFGHRQKKLRLAYRKGACDQELMTRVNTDPIMGGQGIHNNFVTFRV